MAVLFKRLIVALLLVTLASAEAAADSRLWRLEGWANTDFEKASVDFSEIVSGGPGKDGIPSIDAPKFIPAGDETSLGKDEPVIGLALNGDARAYPLRILIWHEIVNDTVGGVPVTVTYCPLCNSAIVFERTVAGRVLDFGTTGKLRNSDLVMYDRQTESWWQQFTGSAIVGKMTGTELKSVPARLESFALFKKRHPEGKVLLAGNRNARPYGVNPYVRYDSRAAPYPLFKGAPPRDINPMARVISLKIGGKPHAVTMGLVSREGRVEIGDVVLSWRAGQNSALDKAEIASGRDVGNIIAQRRTEAGFEDIVYDVTFAFVFNAFHPDAPIRSE
jgi:hypothetical protein